MPNPIIERDQKATTLLDNPRLDQQALAHVYASAFAVHATKGALYPEDYARKAVLDFCELLTEERDDG